MNYLKIVLAVLLLLCLLDMPYGFYILIRYVATVVFGYMAYSYYQENKKELAIAAGALAVPEIRNAVSTKINNAKQHIKNKLKKD